jgi:hypothetical protein
MSRSKVQERQLADIIKQGKELGNDPNADLDSALQKFSDEKLKTAFHQAYIQAKMDRLHMAGKRKTRKSKKRSRKTRRR